MLPARAPRVAAPPQSRFKHVVIGAGYTGLAAARRLAELQPQEPILVLDASSAGEGSAGRNSGFLINLPHNTRMSGYHSPLQIARKQIAMYQAGLDWLAQLSQQGGFDCGWDLAGKYHAAATEGAAGTCARRWRSIATGVWRTPSWTATRCASSWARTTTSSATTR